MNKFLKPLERKKGEAYIEVAIIVLVVCFLIVGFLSIYQFIVLRIRMDRICEDLIEVANYSGCFGSDFDSAVAAKRASEFDFEVAVDGDWYNASLKQVQLGKTMTVTITAHSSLFGLNKLLPVTVSVTRSGLSEQYWRVAGA